MQDGEGGDSSPGEALPGEKTDLDLGLIEPATVFWRVVDREAAPKLCPFFFSEVVRERLAAMDVQVIHDHV